MKDTSKRGSERPKAEKACVCPPRLACLAVGRRRVFNLVLMLVSSSPAEIRG